MAGGNVGLTVELLAKKSLATGVLVLTALGLAGLCYAGPPGDEPDGPPRPVARAHGHELQLVRGSYCWTGGCVDTTGTPRTRRALVVRRGKRVILDLKTPARQLSLISLPDHARYGRPTRRDAAGREWAFPVPKAARRKRNLLLEVAYPQGDAVFGFKIAPR